MALRKPLFMGTEGFSEEMAATDLLALGGLTMTGDIVMGANKITGLGDGSLAQDAVTKSQLDAAVIAGGVVKELLHDQNQLDNTDGINALMAAGFVNTPAVGDTVVFKDITLTRTYTFVANIGAELVATDVSIETSAATAMQRLVTRVNADVANTQWDLTWRATEHPDVNANGTISIIERTSAVGSSSGRVYGTWTTQSDFQILEFASGVTPTVDSDYSNQTTVAASTTDPGAGRMGLRRTVLNLTDGEIHFVLSNDSQYAWDGDASVWNILNGPAAIPDATSASGGGIKGKSTFDSDKGLTVISGVAGVSIDAVTLDFNAGSIQVTGIPSLFEVNGIPVGAAVTAANLDTLTDGSSTTLHSHTHANTTGQTANDHHNQVHDIEGTDHTLSGAASGEVLKASGATTFSFAVLAHSELGSIGTDDHHPQLHTIASHSDTTATGAELETLTDGSNADALHGHAASVATEAPKVEGTYNTATDTTANGDPVYWNGNDTLGKGRADTGTKSRVIGVIRSGGGVAPASVEVVTEGPATGILSAATFNTPYYLGATGGLSTSLPGAHNRVIQMGKAKNATDLWVQIIDYGKKAA